MPTTTNPTTLTIRDAHDGDMWIQLFTASSRRLLSKMVKRANWRSETGCGADCTGRVFSGSATLLRAYHVDGVWIGVVERSNARDV